jgi:hypothetical protein
MMRGRPVVFAGLVNRALASCAKATPRDLLRRTSARWNQPV